MNSDTANTNNRSSVVQVDGNSLTLEDVINVARNGIKATLSREAYKKIAESRQYIQENVVAAKRSVYGINTGFGKFSEITISKEKMLRLQENLIQSHSTAVGEPLSKEVVRAVMLLRSNALAKGFSGVRPVLIETLLEMLNKGVHPIIPSQGSLGASGDLAPLSHMSLVLVGKGEAEFNGQKMDGLTALEAANIKPVCLVEKEGLALINGTQVMTALAAISLYDACVLSQAADVVASMSMEALKAGHDFLDPLLYEARQHPGHLSTIQNINKIRQGSKNAVGEKVQDAYSLRCVPQVHGTTKDGLSFVKKVVEIELNAATDNPLIFPKEGKVLSGGNFHGQPIAQAMDFFCMLFSELGSISERRVEQLLNSSLSGYPPFLVRNGGINSGFMVLQYTAASLVSENKVLSTPASIDSISCSASQEDHVSMGTTAARKARAVIKNLTYILAVEYLVAAQALDFLEENKLGIGIEIAYNCLRAKVPTLKEDRIMYPDIEEAAKIIGNGELLQQINHELSLESW